MTRAIRFTRTGGPEVLELEEIALAEPKAGEALVRHRAIGVNFIDTYHRSGLYPVALPSGLGVEAAGVVERIGPGVTCVRVGERVAYAGAGAPAAYAEARVLPAERLVPVPDDISDDVAAAALLKGMTAEFLIHRTFPVAPGQTVLFHAAAGGVGLIACQWLNRLGARVIGSVGSEAKRDLALAHGCHEVVVLDSGNFADRVRELSDGQGVPVVFDSIGKATFLDSLSCLEPRGMLVSFGNASGKPEPFDLALLAQKGSLYVTRPTLYTYTATREALLASANSLFQAIRDGLKVEIGQRFPLSEAAAAHRALESRSTTGSSLLDVSERMRTKPYATAIALFDEVELLDVAGPISVLSSAGRQWNFQPFKIDLVASSVGAISTRSELTLQATHSATSHSGCECLIIPGGYGARHAAEDAEFLSWLQRATSSAKVVAAIGNGVWLLAKTGLLGEEEVAASPDLAAQIRALFPAARAEPRAAICTSGKFLSARSSALGLDLSCEIVARCFGEKLASSLSAALGIDWAGELGALDIVPSPLLLK